MRNSDVITADMIAKGQEFRRLRENKGMTRRAVSEWLGIPQRTIQTWENGERCPAQYVEDWYKRVMTESDPLTDVERQELRQAIENQIEAYQSIEPLSKRQKEEISTSVGILESLLAKLFS